MTLCRHAQEIYAEVISRVLTSFGKSSATRVGFLWVRCVSFSWRTNIGGDDGALWHDSSPTDAMRWESSYGKPTPRDKCR